VRFIFSHSALREGWDNPNVFVICTLKHSDNTISRRQEVGRGMRLSVNQRGERMDDPATVHQTNVLTVVASESYKDFVSALQKDISESLSARPRIADEEYFTGKVLKTPPAMSPVTPQLAKQIYRIWSKTTTPTKATGSRRGIPRGQETGEQLAPLPKSLQLMPSKSLLLSTACSAMRSCRKSTMIGRSNRIRSAPTSTKRSFRNSGTASTARRLTRFISTPRN
jgi:type III restriction enzyme